MKRFIILVVCAALALRVVVLQFGSAINEVRHGEFDLYYLLIKSGSLTVALTLTLLMALVYQRFVLRFQVSSHRSSLNIIYFLMLVSLSVKLSFPSSKYIDMVIPTTVLGFSLLFYGMNDKNKYVLTIGVLYLLLIGVANHSKGAALRVLFGYVVFWIMLERNVRFQTIIISLLPISLIMYITFQMVYFRANHSYFTLSELGVVSTLVFDVISMRFNFVDGLYLSQDVKTIPIEFFQFLQNMFVYLPFVDSHGYTMGAYVACEIDMNCSGEHAGALGLPAVIDKMPLQSIALFFFGFFLLMMFYVMINKVMPLCLKMGAAGTFTLIFLNVFISGNLDLIFSEMLLTVLGISMVNWMGKLRIGS